MDNNEYNFIITRNRNLMPKYMSDRQFTLDNTIHPSAFELRRNDYLKAWFELFDTSYANDELNIEYHIAEFLNFNVFQIKEAFEFTIDHYSELDLGGNNGWFGVARIVTEYIARSEWNRETRRMLILKCIYDTRWFDYR
jgi:hypothetical protein